MGWGCCEPMHFEVLARLMPKSRPIPWLCAFLKESLAHFVILHVACDRYMCYMYKQDFFDLRLLFASFVYIQHGVDLDLNL